MSQEAIDFIVLSACCAGVVCSALATFLLVHHNLSAISAWMLRTFTKAGDGCSVCRDCNVEIFCFSCRRVQRLTPTQTVTRVEGRSAVVDFAEERRRREAFAAFDEIDLDLDESAVN